MNRNIWHNIPVLVTGHTGFKGGWLSLWLNQLTAKVHGYSLDPPTDPNFFQAVHLQTALTTDNRADIRDLSQLKNTFFKVQPKVVFHLAAQPIVRASYNDPIDTFSSNIMGTVNVLEACRLTPSVQAVVIITTDKVYENKEWLYPYRENDRLGGYDPYSASKAAAEIVISSYRSSFFENNMHSKIRIASVRAGNVIGGGDWAKDRLIPDCIRAFQNNEPVKIRNPSAVRPWQHVLEPLSGYILLAEKLLSPNGSIYANAWNFGPHPFDDMNVGNLVRIAADFWGYNAKIEIDSNQNHPHEAGLLRLDISKAQNILGWIPKLKTQDSIKNTIAWYRAWYDKRDMKEYSLSEIKNYEYLWEKKGISNEN